MNILNEKLKEVFFSILPVTIIVILLNFTLLNIEWSLMARFLLGAGIIIVGLSFFLVGVELGITPFGFILGSLISKRNKLWVVVVSVFVLGFFISFAEPGLFILASQIDTITLGNLSQISILLVVSVGLAIMMVFGFIRILYNFSLNTILYASYGAIFILSFFTTPEFLAIAFDSSGATTGVLAVPFILALSLGVSSFKKNSDVSEPDSFGLVSIASIGAIISVMLLNIFKSKFELSGVLDPPVYEKSFYLFFIDTLKVSLHDSIIALLPMIVIFIGISFMSKSVDKRSLRRISFGFSYSFIGLFLFFCGVNIGFMEVGTVIGTQITNLNTPYLLVAIGFILGMVTILTEPAVYVLTHQIEEVTARYIKRTSVLISLAIGVGFAVGLSVLRIVVPTIQLWHYLLPGYLIAIILTFFTPKLFVGIAFDAGGVATGPMTATFILAFVHGIANTLVGADLLRDGFGMIAMVALMPIITLQVLGLLFKNATKKKEGVEIE